jgi:hypothetical protein
MEVFKLLPKLLPSPFCILKRKIKTIEGVSEIINEYELREVEKDLIYNAPVLSAVLLFLKR